MSSSRALANEKLYHARILANSWRDQLEAEIIPATVLQGAFADAARRQLQQAYGWFLVEIAQPAVKPQAPPGHTEELPAIAPGQAVPGEIRELRQLEKGGWLADVLDTPSEPLVSAKSAHNLALVVPETAHPDQIDTWIEQLTSLFERMSDSLDEY